ncbi:hypothetical protein MRB53_002646 [Persea americana]|uniref:Uncharacterized protein n=1 Tax=Persea americana TaxID=3435 RepID=A0ACC2MVT3_PERAE|nr:hypothetical protein MRB53_002646 [Persea americana]
MEPPFPLWGPPQRLRFAIASRNPSHHIEVGPTRLGKMINLKRCQPFFAGAERVGLGRVGWSGRRAFGFLSTFPSEEEIPTNQTNKKPQTEKQKLDRIYFSCFLRPRVYQKGSIGRKMIKFAATSIGLKGLKHKGIVGTGVVLLACLLPHGQP